MCGVNAMVMALLDINHSSAMYFTLSENATAGVSVISMKYQETSLYNQWLA